MGSILVINSGSTSLKYKLFDLDNFKTLTENDFVDVGDRKEAVKLALREIGNLSMVEVIGHRVVHGGTEFLEPTKIDRGNLDQLEAYNELAPLHNPYNIFGIKACLEFLPDIPNFAVFDTAFYKDLPDKAKIYAIPFELYKEHGIQRYGFHGISQKYASLEAAKILNRELKDINLITCHLGGGSSITVIKQGRAIDTSMGYTPMEGLVMMTRSGDLDPGVILKLKKSLNGDDKGLISEILNKASGLKGISGLDDYLDLLKAVKYKDRRAKLAFDIYIYRIQKYIGAYLAVLDGEVDGLVFTGQIGAGKSITRNTIVGKIRKILGRTKVLTVETDEELMIAREVKEALDRVNI